MEIRDPRRLPLGAIYAIINTTSHSNLSASIPFSLCLALPVSSMALRRTFVKRLIDGYRAAPRPVTLEHCPPLGTIIPPGTARTNSNREYLTSPDSGERGFFRRFLNRRALYQTEATKLPEFLSLPVGEKLREKLRRLNVTGDLLRPERPKSVALHPATGDSFHEFTVKDARRLLRLAQMEKLKAKLRKVPNSSIPYLEFLQICTEGCKDKDQGLEFAKLLDDSGNVVVLGNIVFLRPEQVAKSMESMIYQSMAFPNDPRRKELEQMEEQKAVIDQKAKTLVRGELYCGLGFLTIQTLGFMRLTFWELSWDVMEPICFFVTSLHFAMAYTFFLRTSTEPSFEGYFQRRFKAKQKKLMTVHNFDIEKYNELCKLFYPESLYPSPTSGHHPFHCLNAIHS